MSVGMMRFLLHTRVSSSEQVRLWGALAVRGRTTRTTATRHPKEHRAETWRQERRMDQHRPGGTDARTAVPTPAQASPSAGDRSWPRSAVSDATAVEEA